VNDRGVTFWAWRVETGSGVNALVRAGLWPICNLDGQAEALHSLNVLPIDLCIVFGVLPSRGMNYTLTNVASICLTCGRASLTLFLYTAGPFSCKGFASK